MVAAEAEAEEGARVGAVLGPLCGANGGMPSVRRTDDGRAAAAEGTVSAVGGTASPRFNREGGAMSSLLHSSSTSAQRRGCCRSSLLLPNRALRFVVAVVEAVVALDFFTKAFLMLATVLLRSGERRIATMAPPSLLPSSSPLESGDNGDLRGEVGEGKANSIPPPAPASLTSAAGGQGAYGPAAAAELLPPPPSPMLAVLLALVGNPNSAEEAIRGPRSASEFDCACDTREKHGEAAAVIVVGGAAVTAAELIPPPPPLLLLRCCRWR